MTIRKLTSADLAAFRAFRTEMCRRHPEAFGQTPEEVVGMTDEKLLDWFASVDVFPQKFVLAAFEGDALIGTVGFRRYLCLVCRRTHVACGTCSAPAGEGGCSHP